LLPQNAAAASGSTPSPTATGDHDVKPRLHDQHDQHQQEQKDYELYRLNGVDSRAATTSPTVMASAPPPPGGGPSRQPIPYPAVTSYPQSAAMTGATYAYPAGAIATSQPDFYRPSHLASQPGALPSFRSVDPTHSQQAQMAPGPPMMHQGMPPLQQQGYWGGPHPYGMPQDMHGLPRYPIPPNNLPSLLGHHRGPKKV
jgi:hypothetical protein